MGKFEVLSRLVVLIAVLAGILLHPALQEHRSKLYKLVTTKCPLNWFDGLLDSSASKDNKRSVIKSGSGGIIMTKEELALYTGIEGSKGLYIGILGLVFDVSAGERFYGPGKSYGFFAVINTVVLLNCQGIDGSRAFVTGEFNETGLIDDVSGFNSQQITELFGWMEFYDKSYIYVGKVVGNFYTSDGSPTEALLEVQRLVETAHDEEQRRAEQAAIFPPCNSQWSDSTDTTVWCSNRSGGIERTWAGVPRKFFDPLTQTTRCVCVRSNGPRSDWSKSISKDLEGVIASTTSDRGDLDHPGLKEYDNCPSTAESCTF